MVSTDPIADMLTRIRNAINVAHSEIVLPYSKQKEAVAKLLKSSGFIDNIQVQGEGLTKKLHITINDIEANPRITEIERLSKPGRRLYVGAKEIPMVKQGRGIVIVSTSRGLMTGSEAKQAGIGGELICRVY